MAITNNDRNVQYTRNLYSWKSIDDAITGSNAVKFANELYLPMPQGFIDDDTPASVSDTPSARTTDLIKNKEMITIAPHYHSNRAYMGYLQRARFPEITINTLRGLIGIATRKGSNCDLPSAMEYIKTKATRKGQSLDEVFVMCLSGVLKFGKCTIVVDVDEINNSVHFVIQEARQFINWLEDPDTDDTTMAVFQNVETVLSDYDSFETEEKVSYTAYIIGEDPEDSSVNDAVVVCKYEDNSKVEKIVPSLQGVRFEKLPIVTIGSLENGNDCDPAPLSGVAEIAYTIYRKDADLTNAQYMTCNPMFCISGATGAVPTAYGSTVALVLENPAATAFFPATDTSALNHVKSDMVELKEEAKSFGATLLGPTNGAAESTETVKIRQGAQGATLVGVVQNVMKGIEDALKIAAQISGINPDDVYYSVPTDFSELSLSPQMLTALVGAWQAGIYSKESLVNMMIESGFVKGDVEAEMTRIFSEEPEYAGDDI